MTPGDYEYMCTVCCLWGVFEWKKHVMQGGQESSTEYMAQKHIKSQPTHTHIYIVGCYLQDVNKQSQFERAFAIPTKG